MVLELAALASTPVWRDVDAGTFRNEIIPQGRPAVLKRQVVRWPAAHAAARSAEALYEYICARDLGRSTLTFIASSAGRGVNFERRMQPFHQTLACLLAQTDHPRRQTIYAPEASAAGFPGFARENPLDILDRPVDCGLRIGNAVVGPTHCDDASQVACVVAGRHRFTFFAPEPRSASLAETAELGPGDAVFIPSLWRRSVASLDPLSLLVTYRWFENGGG